MKRIIAFFFAGMCGLVMMFGQTADRLPWVNGTFPEAQSGFEYRSSVGDASTLDEARKIAYSNFLVQISTLAGVETTSNVTQTMSNETEVNNNTENLKESINFQKTNVIKGKSINVAFIKVDEYYEYKNNRYQLWELYEISTTSESFKPYIPKYTDQYGMSAAWRSAIVPGWGQFHKRKTGKGIFFLATEVAAVSSVIFFETRRSDNMRKSKETTHLDIIKEYRNRADKWELYRNVAIGAAAGVYAWNVLDAALAKGKIRYAWISDNLHLTTSNYNDVCFYGVGINF